MPDATVSRPVNGRVSTSRVLVARQPFAPIVQPLVNAPRLPAPVTTGSRKVTVVHDYVTQRGGAERVVLYMLRAFPGADLVTSIYNAATSYPEFRDQTIRTLAMGRVSLFEHNHRLASPLLAPSFSHLKVDADVMLCSSSGWAHGARSTGRKIVYCHTPARWVYQPQRYLAGRNRMARFGLDMAFMALSKWDRRAAVSAHRYVVNSHTVRDRVWNAYGVEAEVLLPPPAVHPGPATPVPGVEPGFHLSVSRLMGYKNIGAICEAFRGLPKQRLVVVGTGPLEEELRRIKPDNVEFVGTVSDEQLRWLYANGRALVAASYEDFGLTPLEAAGFGKPAAVLRWGGYLETVIPGVTGMFFDSPTPTEIRKVVLQLLRADLDPAVLCAHAASFSAEAFMARLQKIVMED